MSRTGWNAGTFGTCRLESKFVEISYSNSVKWYHYNYVHAL